MSINSKDGCGVVPMGIKYASQWLRVDEFATHVFDTHGNLPRTYQSCSAKPHNLVPMKRFARNQMDIIDAFVPRKRFIWDKAATYKEIREMLFLTSSNF